MAIRVGIVGYGNLGRGVQYALKQNPDMQLVSVFTRRNPKDVELVIDCPVDTLSNIASYKGMIDVMILCLGSATDLPQLTKEILKNFNTVDTYDNHAQIPQYLSELREVANESGTTAAISVGWDPGVFSISRALFNAITPVGCDYTFWGKGVSQGHSDAIRRIEGVENAIQYTVPNNMAVEKVLSGSNPILTVKDKHSRSCFVVAKADANKSEIERQIVTMPNYFEPYNTTVQFISAQEFEANHTSMPHGGQVIRSATSGSGNTSIMQLSLTLDSNPEFTSSIAVAYARAVYKMSIKGNIGAYTVLDIPVSYLSVDEDELIRKLL